MNSRKSWVSRLGGLLLVGGLCVVFGAGCATRPTPVEPVSFETLEHACADAINDPETAAKVLVLLEELTSLMSDRVEYLKAYGDRMNALQENYASTEDELRAEIETYNEFRIAGQDRVIEIAGEIRALLSAEEWERLESVRTDQVQTLIDGARWL